MNAEKKKWIKLIIFIFPVISVLFGVNYFIDPANIFHDVSKEVAMSIIEGNRVYVTSGNLNERMVKYNLIQNIPKQVDCIAVGPSLVMCINSEITGEESFYNMGESVADYYDIMAQFGALEIYGKTVDRIIFCVDFLFFDEQMSRRELEQHTELIGYADYMINILQNRDADIAKVKTKGIWSNIRTLCSVQYFQDSMLWIEKTGEIELPIIRYGYADKDCEQAYYELDGSQVYALDFQNNTVEDVREHANSFNMDSYFTPDAHLSHERKENFIKLIQYLRQNGTTVEFFLCPFAPSLWEKIDQNRYPIISELEEFIFDYAKKSQIKVIGSYDPYNVGITDDKFYDSRHIKREVLGEYFDFQK